jgi:para-nitrobenzyl esterase
MLKLALLAAVACASALPSVTQAAELQLTPIIEVQGGSIAGIHEGSLAAFKGIPFAASPVRDLRWQAPQPVAPWPDVRIAESLFSDVSAAAARKKFDLLSR